MMTVKLTVPLEGMHPLSEEFNTLESEELGCTYARWMS